MKIFTNLNCLSVDVLSRINPPLIPLNRAVTENAKECDIIKIKMFWDSYSSTSETYNLKIDIFENSKPEEFLALMKNFKTTIDGTGTMSAPESINYLHTMLCGEYLQ